MFKGRVTRGKVYSFGLALCLSPAHFFLPHSILYFEEEPIPALEEQPTTTSEPLIESTLEPASKIIYSDSEIQILSKDSLYNQDLDGLSPPYLEDIPPEVKSESSVELFTNVESQTAEKIFPGSLSESYVVKVSNDTSIDAYLQILQDAGLIVTGVLQELNAVVVSGDYEILEEFSSVLPEGYSYFEKNLISLSILSAPNDPYYTLQYGLELINAPKGWKYQKGSSKITIAVLDTGVDLAHPELAGKLVSGYNFVANNDKPQDDNGHGTGVAGICAAVTDNGTGIAGVSWGASIMPVKILDASGNGSFTNAAQGIIWAADHGAQVINLSLGGYTSSTLLEDAINYALQKGVIVVAASGNGGVDMITYPARYDGVIAVGSVDQNNQRSAFSNYGSELDVVAPGSAIFSLTLMGNYSYLSGTSAAAPFTSGLVALMLSVKGNSYQKIGNQICRSSLDLGSQGHDDYYGCGLIQVDKSLRLALRSVLLKGTSIKNLYKEKLVGNQQKSDGTNNYSSPNTVLLPERSRTEQIFKKENTLLVEEDNSRKIEELILNQGVSLHQDEVLSLRVWLVALLMTSIFVIGIRYKIKTREPYQ